MYVCICDSIILFGLHYAAGIGRNIAGIARVNTFLFIWDKLLFGASFVLWNEGHVVQCSSGIV
jgi:hypothetical protein